jgi:hypothetical protein
MEGPMKLIVSLATAGLLVSPVAFAQSSPPPATAAAPTSQTASVRPGNADLQQRLKQDLQQAGFTDVSVLPDSFLVQAKDRSGNPVTMIVGPNSMTAIVAQTTSGAGTASSASTTPSDPTTGTAGHAINASAQDGMFTTVPPTDRLSSEVVGLDVYNNANQDIGTIKDIAYTGANVKAYIVAVGGFLGMGDHYVAVSPSDLKVTYDATTKKWHANMDTTADQLKAAPAFTYSSKA